MNVFVKLGYGAKLPEKRKLDAGYDIWSNQEATCYAGKVCQVHTGVFIDMSAAWSPNEPVCSFVKTRSSYALKGLIVVGGVIDSSYRGEIIVLMLNTSDKDVSLPSGEKVAQMTFVRLAPVEMEFTGKQLSESPRGVKAFGSTGQAPPEQEAEAPSEEAETAGGVDESDPGDE